MADSQSRFAALPPRQKASVILFFIFGAVAIYMIIGLFRSGSSNSTTITPEVSKISAKAPTTAMNKIEHPPISNPPHAAGPTGPTMAGPKTPEAHVVSPVLSRPQVEVAPPSAFLLQEDQAQNRYVSAINDLQMLKIQREIAETNQAIVTAKLATVTAEKNITDLLEPEDMGFNKKLPPAPITAAPPSTSTTVTTMTDTKLPYVVQSVTMELDQWHAVLQYKNTLYDVSVGDVLPTDGSTVASIDQKGVVLELGDMKQRIPVTSTDQVPYDTSGGPGSSSSSSTSTGVKPPLIPVGGQAGPPGSTGPAKGAAPMNLAPGG